MTNVAEIFTILQKSTVEGLLTLEIQMIISQPFMILIMLALYAALKKVNESYALLTFVIGIIGMVLIFTARPVAEMVYLNNIKIIFLYVQP